VRLPTDLAGLKIRTIQSSIYVKTVELMGASPTPMAFGEVYTSLQTGVIDGFEHDASTTLQQRFYEVARVMARTRHIAGLLGLWGSMVTLERLPADLGEIIRRSAREASDVQRAAGPREEADALEALMTQGMAVRDIDTGVFRERAEGFWDREARALGVTDWLGTIRA
jgi:TRAP-type C4-dicarboxylate transport system substrate-binding protein